MKKTGLFPIFMCELYHRGEDKKLCFGCQVFGEGGFTPNFKNFFDEREGHAPFLVRFPKNIVFPATTIFRIKIFFNPR